MIFSSYPFLFLFLPAVLFCFYVLRSVGRPESSVTFLLIASALFYAQWRAEHLALLAGSIAVNFLLGRAAAERRRPFAGRAALIGGVAFNLAIIFWFKYFDFAAANIAALAGAAHSLQNLVLPLGISFFTFQQIAYLVDCWTTRRCEKNLRDYSLFVSFFPQLIAGPIVHHSQTRPQFAALARRPVNLDMVPYGLMVFAMGLAKKTLIADPIARGVDPIWAAAAAGEPLSAAAAWTATIGYTAQIYFDFSGYCDMAIGIAAMLGIRLPVNFNSPYKARSIIEFWRRWHITLSNFLRDYVYIPLGGNRGGQLFRLRNIFLTMLIGGIWHGAAWTFVIWGAIHASLITANHALRLWAPSFHRWNDAGAQVVKRTATLAFVMLAWIFFRAEDMSAAGAVIAGLVRLDGAAGDPHLAAMIAFAMALALYAPNSLEVAGYTDDLAKPFPDSRARPARVLRPTSMSAIATATLLAGGIAAAWKPAAFIYFNF